LKAYQKLGMARRSLKNSVCHFSEEPIWALFSDMETSYKNPD
jgi:hypothetical protein